MNDLGDIVRRLGGQLYHGGRSAVIPGPGHSRRDRSLSLMLGEGGRIVFHSHAGDGCREVMAYLGLQPGAGATPRARPRDEARRRRRLAAEREADRTLCAALWNAARPIEATPAAAWLDARGVGRPGWPVLRFHPRAARGKHPGAATHAAMLALVSDRDGDARALHLTFVTGRGAKVFGPRSRLMFGPTAGHAVRLAPPTEGRLAVAEGIETALAYSRLTGVACWAAMSASGLRTFQLPAGIDRLVVAADHDDAGLAAAAVLAERAGRLAQVSIDAPPAAGQDWAEVLAGRAR
jgi:phage/plasmid primase-like uncharacterized protein